MYDSFSLILWWRHMRYGTNYMAYETFNCAVINRMLVSNDFLSRRFIMHPAYTNCFLWCTTKCHVFYWVPNDYLCLDMPLDNNIANNNIANNNIANNYALRGVERYSRLLSAIKQETNETLFPDPSISYWEIPTSAYKTIYNRYPVFALPTSPVAQGRTSGLKHTEISLGDSDQISRGVLHAKVTNEISAWSDTGLLFETLRDIFLRLRLWVTS